MAGLHDARPNAGRSVEKTNKTKMSCQPDGGLDSASKRKQHVPVGFRGVHLHQLTLTWQKCVVSPTVHS